MAESPLEIAFLDVGQGDSIVITLPDTKSAIIIDTPNTMVTERFLEQKDIEVIERVFISHSHSDHSRGVVNLIQGLVKSGVQVRGITYLLDKMKSNALLFSKLLKQIVAFADEGIELGLAYKGSAFVYGPLKISILFPDYRYHTLAVATGRVNLSSVVLLLECYNSKVLLGSDLETDGWRYLFADGTDLTATILKYPHHGADLVDDNGKSICGNLLTAVSPEYVVISAGTGNSHHHPSKGTIHALQKAPFKPKVFCTQATTLCSKDINKLSEKTFALTSGVSDVGLYANYGKGCVCGGTILFHITRSGIIVEPNEVIHEKVKSLFNNPC